MIFLDTTVLIDLWRSRGKTDTPIRSLLGGMRGQELALSAMVYGEFLEGGAAISEERKQDAKRFLLHFTPVPITWETAETYAEIVARIRQTSRSSQQSKADMWIAATAIRHHAPLISRNSRHFRNVQGLELITYPAK